VIIDWIGVGRGPRTWPLAFLLFAAGPRGARRGLHRYTRSISLSEEELRRLPGIHIHTQSVSTAQPPSLFRSRTLNRILQMQGIEVVLSGFRCRE
jgi:hypothetical protein